MDVLEQGPSFVGVVWASQDEVLRRFFAFTARWASGAFHSAESIKIVVERRVSHSQLVYRANLPP